ncbi:MAG TPA: class I SAM-dependent methyltransferase [Steroidobacteraceae bacterium]
MSTNYLLSSAGREEAERSRLELLQQIFDPASCSRLEFVRPGWRCLDVGAGRGSIAAWLSQRVGDAGRIVATDIDTAGLQHLSACCEVLRHDFLEDPLDALQPASFDLVFARFVLVHLAGKQEVALRRMIECLRPGGWLVIEDLDMSTFGSANPWHPLAAEFDDIVKAMQEGYRTRGMLEQTCGRMLGASLRRFGLINVNHEVTAKIHAGASPVARWHAESMQAITASLIKREIPDRAREAAVASTGTLTKALEDPEFFFLDQLYHAARGQRAPA